MASVPEEATTDRGNRKQRTGTVVAAAMNKSVVVEVRASAQHPTYGKIVRRKVRLNVHDEDNQAGERTLDPVANLRRQGECVAWAAGERPRIRLRLDLVDS